MKHVVLIFCLLYLPFCYGESAVTYQVTSTLPTTTNTDINYPVSYTFTNHLPFTLTTFEINATTKNAKLTLQQDAQSTCSKILASETSCTYTFNYLPLSQGNGDVTLVIKYNGNEAELPSLTTNTSIVPWQKVGTDFSLETLSIAHAGSILFAASRDQGVWCNDADNPSTWVRLGNNIGTVYKLLVAGNTIYATTGQPASVYAHALSNQAGDNDWKAVGSLPDGAVLISNLINFNETLYALDFFGGIYQHSTALDQKSWEQVGSSIGSSAYGLINSQSYLYASNLNAFYKPLSTGTWQSLPAETIGTINELTIFNNTLYALGTASGDDSSGIQSRAVNDFSSNWTALNMGLPKKFTGYSLMLLDNKFYLAGEDRTNYPSSETYHLYESNNISQDGWHSIVEMKNNEGPVRQLIAFNHKIYAATNDGIYRFDQN